MFQTHLNLSLQSLASGGLTAFMKGVTATGYEPFYVGLLIIVMMGVDFRRGFLLFQLIVWTGMLTEVLKHLFALPRPTWVDAHVLDLESGQPNASAFVGPGAPGFLQPLPGEVVDAFRRFGASYGFPSGHVGGACAVWGGLAVLFRKQLLYWVAPAMIVLMALSRMYLGRHFLADVLGGAIVGGAMLALAIVLLDRARWRERLFEWRNLVFSFHLPNVVLLFVLLILPLLLLGLSFIESDQAGYVVGLDSAFVMLVRKGLPANGGRRFQRIARVLLVAFLFLMAALVLRAGGSLVGIDGSNPAIRFSQAAIPSFLAFWAGVLLCDKLRLYGNDQRIAEVRC
jgi:membrane-associated phospholipid phosphatase